MTLEANNSTLAAQVADLKVEIALKDKEFRQLQAQSKEGLDRIWDFIGNPGDVVNKAGLFNNKIKTEGQLSAPKIIIFLVEFGRRMEATLVKMQKLVPGPQLEPIWLPLPSPKSTLQKTRPIVQLKTPLPQRLGKELILEAVKKATPTIVVSATEKMTKKESETPKTTSSEPSLQQRSTIKKKKEPTLDSSSEEEEAKSSEDVEELEVVTSNDEPRFDEEEAEPATPPPEKKKKIKTWASKWKKSAPISKTPVSLKRPMKTPKKGESSQKKPKTKQIVSR